jgi:predicted ATPase
MLHRLSKYFTEKIGENGLYLLDEPENSLSPKRQTELKKFLEDSARFFGCQFIISTHSPFLLAMPGVKIYDLDDPPAKVKQWTELENMRVYREFFMSQKFDD